MRRYLKIQIWDMILCAVMIFAISTTAFAGFRASDPYLHSYLFTIVGSVILTVLLMMAFYSKRSIVIGAGLLVAAFVALVVIGMANQVNVFADVEGNRCFRILLLLASALGVVILSRFRIGSIFLFACGLFLIGLIQFMYENNLVLMLLLFLIAGAVMIAYRNYMVNVLGTATVAVSPVAAVSIAFLLTAIVTAVSCGAFFGIVRPIDPPAKEVKILTKYMSLEVMEQIGVASVNTVHDLEENANNDQKEEMTVSKSADQDKNGRITDDPDNGAAKDKNRNELAEWIKYHRDALIRLLPILIAIVIAAAYLLKLMTRRWQLKGFLDMEPDRRIPALYQYFLACLARVGINRHQEETPYEFAARTRAQTRDFYVGDTGIPELTETLVAMKYGVRKVEEGELGAYVAYYKGIFSCLRKQLGFKYLWYYFLV